MWGQTSLFQAFGWVQGPHSLGVDPGAPRANSRSGGFPPMESTTPPAPELTTNPNALIVTPTRSESEVERDRDEAVEAGWGGGGREGEGGGGEVARFIAGSLASGCSGLVAHFLPGFMCCLCCSILEVLPVLPVGYWHCVALAGSFASVLTCF